MNKSTTPHPMDPIEVGKRLEALRIALDIKTQKEFAESASMAPTTYTQIAKGNRGLPLLAAYSVAQRWDVSMDFLYRGDLSRLESDLRSKILKGLETA